MKKESLIIWGIAIVLLGGVAFGIIKMSGNPQSATQQLSEPILSTDHVEGDTNSKAVLVEYGDFQCPACGQYFPIVEKLLSDYQGKILFVFRNFPLSQHPNAIPAAYAAEAAGMQGKYWDMFRAIYEHQNDWSEKTNAGDIFLGYAKTMGLDLAKYKADVTLSATTGKVSHDIQTGNASKVNATPTFFLNGSVIHPQSYDEFKQLIDAALATK